MNDIQSKDRAERSLRTQLGELSTAGEQLSADEIDLVAGGVGADIDFSKPAPQRTCPHTLPINDDFSCSGGWLD